MTHIEIRSKPSDHINQAIEFVRKDADWDVLAMDITRLIYTKYGQRFDVQLRL